MMHDPFQTYSMLGAYPGFTSALGVNPAALNPLAGGISPFGQQQGIQGYGGVNPQQLQQQQLQQQLQQLQQQQLQQHLLQQQLQLAAILAQATNPQLAGVTGWNNPLATIGLQQNPLISQVLQNPLLNPILAQHYQQQQQYPQIGLGGGSPFGQIGSPFGQTGYPLAPQSWIGQQGLGVGSPFGQGHPLLSQLGGRGVQGHGMSPWSGF